MEQMITEVSLGKREEFNTEFTAVAEESDRIINKYKKDNEDLRQKVCTAII